VSERAPLARRHLRAGWLALLVAGALGLVLETLLGLRLPIYVDLDLESRRTLWRLAHAHLALLGLVHIAFALSSSRLGAARVTSWLLMGSFLMPLGFWLGGAVLSGSEPGPLVLLAPLGGVAFLGGLAGATVLAWRTSSTTG
jgi:hypothetical protein